MEYKYIIFNLISVKLGPVAKKLRDCLKIKYYMQLIVR